MPQNRATIYSNGIADFQRIFSVSSHSSNKISIPVRQNHLADVLASLTVSGDVTVESPPSFQPANQDDIKIVISNSNSFVDLANQLAGADVKLTIGDKKIVGRLVGIQNQQMATTGEPINEQFLVLLDQNGLNKFSLRQIENLFFIEETIQAEINKALGHSLQEINPNSTSVELKLRTKKKQVDAIVQYTIPAATWKISYRLILLEDDRIELQGHAIVDNNTDENWNDFMIAVVMGQPITFSTDLADTKIPRRSHVNVVQDAAIGSVEIEEGIEEVRHVVNPDAFKRSGGVAAAEPRMRLMESRKRVDSAAIESSHIEETGDFCIFESPYPVSIDAHRSAIIPVFQTTLEKSRPVLFFKTDNHPKRPFRTILFENSTGHSLGRGVCTVYDQTTYAGSCVVPATQTKGKALLPHALETSVRVVRDSQPIESRRIGVRISNGVAVESYHKLKRTEYVINSNRDENFQFLLDHDVMIEEAQVSCHLNRGDVKAAPLETEKLENGKRVEFELLSNDVVQVDFVETAVAKSRVRLVGKLPADEEFNVRWLYTNFVDANTSLAQDPQILKCIELQRLLDELEDQIGYAKSELTRLNGRQERLRKNINAGVSDQQKARWQEALARAEDNMVQLEEEHLPELIRDRDIRHRELYDALHAITIDWGK